MSYKLFINIGSQLSSGSQQYFHIGMKHMIIKIRH